MKRVVFIEGPTGVGKGYLINSLKVLLEDKFKVRVLRAADYVLEECPEENRKYTKYTTPEKDLAKIEAKHISMLYMLSDAIKASDEVILVDRSYLSFVVYNLMSHDTKWVMYLEDWFFLLANTIQEENYLVVSLVTEKDTTDPAVLEERILGRKDSKPVDKNWLVELVKRYDLVNEYGTKRNSNYLLTTSSEAESVFNLMTDI